MGFKNVTMKLRQSLLCCSKHERKSLDIGLPTDVRRIDIFDSLPGLTDAERKHIREKASSDAIRLLSLQSHPPTSPPSPTGSSTPTNPFHTPVIGFNSADTASEHSSSVISSREPSMALLNAASKDLPTSVPTPSRRTHHENSPPAMRMKSMWDSSRRYSSDSTGEDEVEEKIVHTKGADKDRAESFRTLNLDFDWEEKKDRVDSPRTLSLTEGFEMQDTVGGKEVSKGRTLKNVTIRRAVQATEIDDSSYSEVDSFITQEQKPLVHV